MVSKARERTGTKAAAVSRQARTPDITEDERILREATKHLIRYHGGLFVATVLRREPYEGVPRWIITVTLRYPTGHEGNVGELLYDGEKFTFLTEQSVIDDRVQKIADAPEGLRQWDEYRASTLQPGKE